MRFRLLILLLALCRTATAETRTLGVCEALNSSIVREEVSIRGVLIFHMEGFHLIEGPEVERCPSWRPRFLALPAFIGLSLISNDVKLTSEQEQRNREFWLRLHVLRGGIEKVLMRPATIKGVLIKKFLPIVFQLHGDCFGNGFGPQGCYPASLVITEVPTGF